MGSLSSGPRLFVFVFWSLSSGPRFLRLWFLISEKLGQWHDIARAHTEMTRGVVDAIERGDPVEAELALKFYVHARLKEIRELL